MNPQIPHFTSVDIKGGNGKNAIFIIGVRPTPPFISNLTALTQYYAGLKEPYDVFFIPDDDGQPFLHPDLNIMQVSKMEWSQNGFQHLIMFHNTVPNNAHVSGWDKALYIASSLNSYDNYWFVEDDVVYSEPGIFHKLDKGNDHVDLMCRNLRPSPFFPAPAIEEILKDNWEIDPNSSIPRKGKQKGYWDSLPIFQKCWKLAGQKKYKEAAEMYLKESSKYEWLTPPPHIHGDSQVIRFSKNLLKVISDFAAAHNTLYIQEYIFFTLAYHHNLKIKCFSWTEGGEPTNRELITAFDSHFKNFNNIEFFEHQHFETDYVRAWVPPIENDTSLSDQEKAKKIFERAEFGQIDGKNVRLNPRLTIPFFYHPIKNPKINHFLRELLCSNSPS